MFTILVQERKCHQESPSRYVTASCLFVCLQPYLSRSLPQAPSYPPRLK